MVGVKNSLALSECSLSIGGLEPPVSARRSSKHDCGKAKPQLPDDTPNAQINLEGTEPHSLCGGVAQKSQT